MESLDWNTAVPVKTLQTVLDYGLTQQECSTNINNPPCKFTVPFLLVLVCTNVQVSTSSKLVERVFYSICHVCVRWLINTTTSINSTPNLRISYLLMDISQVHLTLTAHIRDLNLANFPLFLYKTCSFRRHILSTSIMQKENSDIFEKSDCAGNVSRQVCLQCLCRLHTAPC